MIDITGLREDKRPQSSTIVHALLDRLEAAEAEALEEARLNGMGSEREAALMAKLEAAERERDECNRRRLEAADHFAAQTALMKEKYDDLRAKIEATEKQEPVARTVRGVAEWVSNGDGTYSLGGCLEAVAPLPDDTQLYALPGAQTQPAPSIPEGWLRAIDEALVVAHIGVANASDTYEQGKAKLDSLIGFHVDVATDPAVNGGWKLVPIVSTHEMKEAGVCAGAVYYAIAKDVWSAMLAAAPEAKVEPSVPDGWKQIPEKHPTFDLVDLRLADGSVLCGCVPQSDGDYWWEGPSGEVFIDPKYAPATHWRLTAAPEANPCP